MSTTMTEVRNGRRAIGHSVRRGGQYVALYLSEPVNLVE